MVATGYRVALGGQAATGIASILPEGVVAVEVRGPIAPDPSYPGELALVANAIEARRVEHARGRSCARRALAALDLAASPILASADRAPIWPDGVVGSITHCGDTYCCSAVTRTTRYTELGIDAELLRPLEAGVRRIVLRPVEERALAQLDPAIPWSCVVFSIKEAIFKALYPRRRKWIDFLDVEVTLDVARVSFEAIGPEVVHGKFALDGDLVLAAVVR